MTPPVSSKKKSAADARPLDFYHWLAWRGMNPNRRRPLGRTAALLMDYRAYLERAVGKENAAQWFDKYTKKVEGRGFSERSGDPERASGRVEGSPAEPPEQTKRALAPEVE